MKVSADMMASNADKASDLLKALANPHRLMILCRLIDGERSVGELAACLDLRLSTMSQHLSLLRRDGLVVPRRDGQMVRYRLSDPAARRVLETLFAVFCAPCPDEGGRRAAAIALPARRRRSPRS